MSYRWSGGVRRLVDELASVLDEFGMRFETGPKGTGLGLAICRRIVQRYSGTISAHSENGFGAAFVVALQVVASDNPSVSTQYDDETAY